VYLYAVYAWLMQAARIVVTAVARVVLTGNAARALA
jgi:hypothetical protein